MRKDILNPSEPDSTIESPINQTLENLGAGLKVLADDVNMLENRLTPVLSSVSDTQMEIDPILPYGESSVVQGLTSQTASITVLHKRLLRILQSLEV